MTLACEDAYSILVEAVTIDAEKRVDYSLVLIWKLKFWRQDKFLVILRAQGLVKILKLKFQQD